ncbi:hypothetical protein GCM10009634_54630 [Saccharothrix xinjiangensis]
MSPARQGCNFLSASAERAGQTGTERGETPPEQNKQHSVLPQPGRDKEQTECEAGSALREEAGTGRFDTAKTNELSFKHKRNTGNTKPRNEPR